jgi:hypothetical protein
MPESERRSGSVIAPTVNTEPRRRPRNVRSASIELLERRVLLTSAPVGWTPLANAPPGSPNAIEQLSDGSILIAYDPAGAGGNAKKTYAKLTPNASGSYINGTWSLLASANISRLDFPTITLRDGRMFATGGEYGAAGSNDPTTDTSEIYNPLTNSWTIAAAANMGHISDAMSLSLPNGDVLVGPVSPTLSGATMIYHVARDTWSQGPKIVTGFNTNEETFVKLKDDTILSAHRDNTTSERYVPWLNKWIADAPVPVPLFDSKGEIGGGILLADGRVFYQGGNGHTALYTPSVSLAPGSWVAGPTMPVVGGAQLGADDAPIVMMPDGRVLMAAGPANTYNAPTYFYIYDPAANSLSPASGAPNINDPVFGALLMNLPDGTILYTTRFGNGVSVPRVYVFNPGVTPLASAKPTISNLAHNADGSYTLTGTLLNGINEGNSYGDDQVQDTNFPLVRLTSGSNVYYARTYNWSNMGVATGSLAETTNFVLPLGLPVGNYSLQVIANGFASDPVPFSLSNAGNAAPTIASLAAASPSPVTTGTTTNLSVLGNDDGGAENLTYTWVTTSLPAGAPAPSFSINGTNASRNTTATFYKRGTYTFKVYITDSADLSNSSSVTMSVTSTAVPAAFHVSPSAIFARELFYNNSAFDGNDAAANVTTDEAAVAPDKQALVAGGSSSFANISSSTRGINGVIIDIAGLPAGGTLAADDFAFKVGNTADASTWADGPAPQSITVFPKSGDQASDRVEIIWADGSIVNEWLQVTVKATAATGLVNPDVSYYGSLVGATSGLSVGDADVAAVRQHNGETAAADSRYDFNRNGLITAADIAAAKASLGKFLVPLSIPALPPVVYDDGIYDVGPAAAPAIIAPVAGAPLAESTVARALMPARMGLGVPWWASKRRKAIYDAV